MQRDLSIYYNRSIKMKQRFAQARSSVEEEAIVQAFVDSLQEEGLSSDEIKKVLNIELVLDSQNNRQMISNNAAYKAAVAKALGEKK